VTGKPRQARRRPGGTRDAGVSVLELVVAMSLFVTLTGIFLAAVVQMGSATVRTSNTEENAAVARKVYTRLDQQVRAASAVNTPEMVNGSWYLEFRTEAVPAGQSVRCTQWKLAPSTGTVSFRTFPDTATPGTPAWTTVATTFRWTSANPPPLVMLPAGGAYGRQRLAVNLTFQRGSTRSAALDTVLVARNTNLTTPTNTLTAAGTTAAPVCQQAGRP
jgi:hypothetical protein